MQIISRNQPGGGQCSNCQVLTTTVSWTFQHQRGIAWQNVGTVHLCRPCMVQQAEAIEGLRFNRPMIDTLKAHEVEVPHNASSEWLNAALDEHGLTYPGEDGKPQGRAAEGPRRGTRAWWADKASAADVPLLDDQTIEQIETRIGIWQQARERQISLPDDMSNEDALAALQASVEAAGGVV
jgi:hypothetical protein